ncbi:hypothetical protein JJB09_16040 [Rhizobium sp. KVB221]|uniref:Calcium-binding protein n=1 Tax=Rhizobium setariae TaxID=2801340 RepID=A0A937CQW5_9HYPH|nr:calcium-binding protein [Rhizobium setariae]MBL0373537.1 hypothetical protein [Rhizobium setariae]
MAIVQHYIVGGVSRSILEALDLAKAQGTSILSAGQNDPFNPAVVQLRNGSAVLFTQLSGENVTQSQAFPGQLEGLFDKVIFGEGSSTATQVYSIEISTLPTSGSMFNSLFNVNVPASAFSAATIAAALLSESDDIQGTAIADQLLSFDGDDVIHAYGGDDFAWGGNGDDFILGGDGADALTGANGDDFLNGGTGDDNLDGGDGEDTLLGKDGNDVLNGGAGADVIIGGAGTDTVRLTTESTVNLIDPTKNLGEAKGDEYSSVEIFSFDVGDDHFVGSTGDDVVLGDAGNDVLRGAGGNDTLSGGDGNDELVGGAGIDNLIGGKGPDILSGGGGKDYFEFDSVSEMGKTASTRDLITDFIHLSDKIDLSSIDANGGVSGEGNFSFVAAEGHGFTGVKGQLTWDQQGTGNGSHTLISGDIDGDKVSDFQIDLSGRVDLTAADFAL